MSSASFYTDRTQAPTPRVHEEISADVWRGLVTLIFRRVDDGSLAREFPLYTCRYPVSAITGTDAQRLNATLRALIPQLKETANPWESGAIPLDPDRRPRTPIVLDVIDFIAQHIDEPARRYQHGDMQHEHLEFNHNISRNKGRQRFRDDVELIFARNGIAFTVGTDMKVARLGPPEARPLLSDLAPTTGDTKLDELLRTAHTRFLSRKPQDRVDALEKVWDAFERLKTLENPASKKASIEQLLAKAAGGDALFQAHLDTECAELTKIGNNFHIRHFEANKQALPTPTETSVDYLFTRVLSLVAYLLRQTGRA